MASPAALLSLVVAIIAAGSTAADVLAGSYGNDVGCAGVLAGCQDSDEYVVLTADGVETYGSGCRFAQQLVTKPGTQSLSSTCFAEGEEGETPETVKVTNRGADGFFVTIPDLEEVGPLKSCS
ncbi:hypothetical protein LHFGNBLO_003082 [Mesorhizobium sp. AR10]|uniref:hypothetical protein n=1 Tax=Mesorhizobium sp. AR10 TaxID=2865839 RepID=UPI00215ED9B1|nr:hypothetical protein [Mesorhizobium sp. AR10]UVK36190.1 hypothetical protein LHFGNBLO_003082 [Mesorhizobium sp. AR10]